MDRPLEVGDYVTITLDDRHYDYVVRNIVGLDIYISTSDQPQNIIRLYPLNGNYVIEGAESLTYLIAFSASNSDQSSDVLTGNLYLDIDILTSFDHKDLETFCQINNPEVQILCSNDSLWINKIIQDFGSEANSMKPPAVGLKEYYYDLVNFPTDENLIKYGFWSILKNPGRGRPGALKPKRILRSREDEETEKAASIYIENVARKGEVYLLNKLVEQGFRPNEKYAHVAVVFNQLPFLIRLAQLGVYPDEKSGLTAGLNANIPILEWMMTNNLLPQVGEEDHSRYVKYDSIPQFSWAHIITNAVQKGNIPFLEWIESKGVVFDEKIAKVAVLYQQPQVVEWLRKRGITTDIQPRELPQTWEEALEKIDLITQDRENEDRYNSIEITQISQNLGLTFYGRLIARQLRRAILKHFNLQE